MLDFGRDFLASFAPDIVFLADNFPKQPRCSIDTRSLESGDIFVALVGDKDDGHKHIETAFELGASGVVMDAAKRSVLDKLDASVWSDKFVALVPDPYDFLIELARNWRQKFTYPLVAITGSVGKTSSKEIVSRILSRAGIKHLATLGNQNTMLGVALNILKLHGQHRTAVFEVGISSRGEMRRIADILRPTSAAVTCVGHCHMAGLGSINDIASEKRAIFSFFAEDGIGIVNGDQPILANVSYGHPVIRFGSKTTNQVQARKIQMGSDKATFVLKLYGVRHKITVHNNHIGSVFNALVASAIAHVLDIDQKIIVEAIQEPLNIARRFERRTLKNVSGVLIDDAYNASPESVKAALLAFEKVQTNGTKLAVLGDMLELGVNAPFWHRQLGRFLRKVPSLREVVLVGEHVRWTKSTVPLGVKVHMAQNWEEATRLVKGQIGQDSVVLVKGSLALGLSHLVDELSSSVITQERA
ncbi:UDP-N-acetylmuramoyl-tripeptide--D-alanyl-D-alanine ligase [bacterium]|jgi:UDP-N-acetylmuramoyl-tripeptide--D-alanyl-D-alanine ligase|nr:UDP-N-acetylmuramoyl-tripeptide--D-alanyl-D-alanine ligase [bacterium]MBT3903222.1 UDP-N-acetylmuramoyl-tripeptide--D-alanyl-D-alanine ligase [bacterium]MBT4578060.1 UDP-N-acetylmuramoyl-tripeptide--D-alanyl-D-alanine ligase [bacterium]MBT5346005.1 UDP-N-acetylmuramoyl-tripeptide--D-alanyl-D-alanine ligase [bacterium]MBT6131242.1 UDP-N-acetylmuramoyl-tripeptide--D-alanyl-D-alanine ligase [bacterium]